MIILPERQIENDVYSILLKPTEMGNEEYTAEEEIAYLKDTPQILDYSDIDFSGKFVIVNGLPTISDESGAVEVIVKPIKKKIRLSEDMEISLSINANSIDDSELDSVVFTDKRVLAQAKIILFETRIKEQIDKLLDKARGYLNDFENTVEETL